MWCIKAHVNVATLCWRWHQQERLILKGVRATLRPGVASTSMTSIRTLTHYPATSPPIFGDVVFIILWPNVVNYSFTLVLDKHPCKVIPRERIAPELQLVMNKCSVIHIQPVCVLWLTIVLQGGQGYRL